MKRINENDAPSRQEDIQENAHRTFLDEVAKAREREWINLDLLGFLDKIAKVKKLEYIDNTNVEEVINDLNLRENLVLSYETAENSKPMGKIFQSLHANNNLKKLTIQGYGDYEEDEQYIDEEDDDEDELSGNNNLEWGMILSAQRGGILPKDIFEMLNSNKTLTDLVINRKILWNSNKSFQDENPYSVLDTSSTDFQDDLLELVKSSLHNNTSLTHINLDSTGAGTQAPKAIETFNLINLEIKFNSCMSYFENKFLKFSESVFLDSVLANNNFENLLSAAKFLKQSKGKFNKYEDFADNNFFFLSGVCKAHAPLSPLPLDIHNKCVHDLPLASWSFHIYENQPTECLGNLEDYIDYINIDS